MYLEKGILQQIGLHAWVVADAVKSSQMIISPFAERYIEIGSKWPAEFVYLLLKSLYGLTRGFYLVLIGIFSFNSSVISFVISVIGMTCNHGIPTPQVRFFNKI